MAHKGTTTCIGFTDALVLDVMVLGLVYGDIQGLYLLGSYTDLINTSVPSLMCQLRWGLSSKSQPPVTYRFLVEYKGGNNTHRVPI